MTRDELTQAAIDCLGKAFKSPSGARIPSDVIQAAVTIVLAPIVRTS